MWSEDRYGTSLDSQDTSSFSFEAVENKYLRGNHRDVFILFFLHLTFHAFDIALGFRFARLSEQVSMVEKLIYAKGVVFVW